MDEDRICDGKFDCIDAADERDCATCDPDREFRCEGGECIGVDSRCDGKRDCRDGTDELDCPVCDPREEPLRFRPSLGPRGGCSTNDQLITQGLGLL